MVNRANVEKVISLIDAAPEGGNFDDEGFSMTDYYHDCGTPQCLAGFTDAARLGLGYCDNVDRAAHEEAMNEGFFKDVFDRRAEFLGITKEQAWKLYHPDQNLVPWHEISKADALGVLRWLMVTGEVDWTIAMEEQWEPLTPETENEYV